MFEPDGISSEDAGMQEGMEAMMGFMAKMLKGKPQKEIILLQTIHVLLQTTTRFSDYGDPKGNHPNITEAKLEEIIEYLGMVQGGLEQYLKENPILDSEETEK